VWRRKPAAGLVHHSDRGTQHTALSLGKRLEGVGALSLRWEGRASPRSLDNATISESLVSTLKCELLVHHWRFPIRGIVRSAVFFEYLWRSLATEGGYATRSVT
jgi:putative transposase